MKFGAGSKLETIWDDAFDQCAALKSITIPASTKTIRSWAFSNCYNLTEVKFQEGAALELLGTEVFAGCKKLTNVEIPSTLITYGGAAFSECDKLYEGNGYVGDSLNPCMILINGKKTDYSINPACIFIDQGACANANVTNITIPSSVREIKRQAFKYAQCQKLTFAAGSRLKTIEMEAFAGMSFVVYRGSITIPKSVTSIGQWAFQNNTLSDLAFEEGIHLETLGRGAFQNCPKLEKITIPSSMSAIGEEMFLGCTKLYRMTIAASVAEIAASAFSGCTLLTYLTIPSDSQLTSIGVSAFEGAAIKTLTLPESLQTIAEKAFYGCPSLTSLSLPASLLTIGNEAFRGCTSLATITFAEGSHLSYIGAYAFYEASLVALELPASLLTIGNEAFRGCTSLATITFAEGSHLSYIGAYAFYEASLVALELPASLTLLGEGAFARCLCLKSVSFQNGIQLEDLGLVTFAGDLGLQNFVIPEGVTALRSALAGCELLASVTIPTSVKTISGAAFSECTHLAEINYLGTVEQWGEVTTLDGWNKDVKATCVHCSDGDVPFNA